MIYVRRVDAINSGFNGKGGSSNQYSGSRGKNVMNPKNTLIAPRYFSRKAELNPVCLAFSPAHLKEIVG